MCAYTGYTTGFIKTRFFFFLLFYIHFSYTVLLRCRGFHFYLWIYTQSIELLRRVTGPSQGLYLNTGQHKHRINAHTPNSHVLSGIRTYDHSVRASEDSSCLRPLGYRDRLKHILIKLTSFTAL
jgi:hypothetical protein